MLRSKYTIIRDTPSTYRGAAKRRAASFVRGRSGFLISYGEKSRITLWDQGIFGGVSLHFAKSFQVYFNPLSQRDSCICLSMIVYHG